MRKSIWYTSTPIQNKSSQEIRTAGHVHNLIISTKNLQPASYLTLMDRMLSVRRQECLLSTESAASSVRPRHQDVLTVTKLISGKARLQSQATGLQRSSAFNLSTVLSLNDSQLVDACVQNQLCQSLSYNCKPSLLFLLRILIPLWKALKFDHLNWNPWKFHK